ncbi:imidazole glycerol phosphate synthase subunit HisH [Mucilaginibacter arboris]|uniref:Imidazole glycerol phosphate synthase subunit HisH n=1 Tax=Mucilaginibacter arboris TaxID=2682090 RepID=A0A7K1SXW8_9SPHI|nr:imidazole glycerol phosphate synthase subunit HisH [Mucilaginibacter arboris]MVN22165.1 imidazole glycerol phosphate synthase subunit HisH [Mucilaginibacter arboris]
MIGIIQYGAGNIFSLTAALDRLGIRYGMISHESDFEQYDRYIIPGVGHAGAAMGKLENTGLVPAIRQLKKPVLGVCVGMQLITAFSEEGNAGLLNIVPVKTLRFQEDTSLKVPHTGWNRVYSRETDDLFKGIDQDAYFYFVHSYFIEYNNLYTLASTQYGIEFSAAIRKDNFFGVQFHPEKSGSAGETLLKNFAHL